MGAKACCCNAIPFADSCETFVQCVIHCSFCQNLLGAFENDRTISFIPPDGEFDLMTYRLNTHVKPLIWVEAVVEPHKGSRIEYMIKTKSQFKSRSIANNVEIIIPVPSDVDSPSFKSR